MSPKMKCSRCRWFCRCESIWLQHTSTNRQAASRTFYVCDGDEYRVRSISCRSSAGSEHAASRARRPEQL